MCNASQGGTVSEDAESPFLNRRSRMGLCWNFLDGVWADRLGLDDADDRADSDMHLLGDLLYGQAGLPQAQHLAAVKDALGPTDGVAALRTMQARILHSRHHPFTDNVFF